MQYSDMQTYVFDRLNISVNDAGRLAQVKNLLNQYYFLLSAEEELLVGFSTLSVTANATSVALPAGTTAIRTLRNAGYPMQPITEEELMTYTAAGVIGVPPTPPAAPLYYCLLSPLVIGLFPSPTTGATLTGLFVQTPAALSAAGDVPTLMPTAFHMLLPELVVKHIAISEEALWPQNLGSEIADDLTQRFRAWNREQQGQSTSVIPLNGYTATVKSSPVPLRGYPY